MAGPQLAEVQRGAGCPSFGSSGPGLRGGTGKGAEAEGSCLSPLATP